MRWRLILIGLLAYTAFTVASLPAAQAYRWLAPYKPEAFQPGALHGSIWHGRATGGRIGAVKYDQLNWQFLPSDLLRGSLGANLELRQGDAYARGRVLKNIDGSIEAHAVEAQLPATLVAQFAKVNQMVKPSGSVNAKISAIEFADQKLRYAEGIAVWSDAAIQMQKKLALGSFRAEIETKNETIIAAIRDAGGPVGINGNATLDPEKRYRVTGKLQARPSADAQLKQMIKMAGKADRDGRIPIQLSGQLQ
jgi:general secretion pathway protein N